MSFFLGKSFGISRGGFALVLDCGSRDLVKWGVGSEYLFQVDVRVKSSEEDLEPFLALLQVRKIPLRAVVVSTALAALSPGLER